MFTFSRHMDGKSKCFDLWTSYSEYELNRNALLDQLMYVNIEIYMGCWVFPPKILIFLNNKIEKKMLYASQILIYLLKVTASKLL